MSKRKTRSSLAVLTVLGMLVALMPLVAVPVSAADDHLLLTEIVVTPTEGEFIEIHNPTGAAIVLTDYYLTDATFAGGGAYYYNIVTGADYGGGGFADFHSRFPAGASIGGGEFQTIALNGSTNFNATYGTLPTYELYEDDASPDSVPDMLEAVTGSINRQGGLSNDGEFVVLYTWDGASDLVTDVDYAVWGDQVEAVDKTGVSTDGPDADATASTYQNDTPIFAQDILASGSHSNGQSWQRFDSTEGAEAGTGGNGIGGDDETSENVGTTWVTGAPTPGTAATAPVAEIVINEIMQNPSAVADSAGEWFELYNPGSSAVDINGWTIADADIDSHVIAAGGPLEIPAGGFVVLGISADSATNGGVIVDYSYGGGWFLSNSADEVVLLDDLAREVDRVEYDDGATFPDPDGASMALIDPGLDNNAGANWCESTSPYGDGDSGTPGATNDCVLVIPEINISEIRIDQPGSDVDEFVELEGPAGASVTGLTYLVIGDGAGGSGVIENVTTLDGTIPSSGFFVLAEGTFSLGAADQTTSLNFENSDNVTHLVVAGFTGSNEDDLDTDDDGVLDAEPWDEVLDSVALIASVGTGDQVYSTNTVGPDGSYVPGHVYLCDGFVIGGFSGGDETPGSANVCEYKIWQIQGSGDASPFVGDPVIVEAVVIGDYQSNSSPDNGDKSGFFLQEEDADADGDPSTSDGVFVFDGSFGVDVAVGDLVSVSGNVTEFFGLTEINNLTDVTVVSSGNPGPTPATVTLPSTGPGYFEAFEGMSVLFPQALTISEYFNFDRFGEIVLTLGRAAQPTAVFEPGSAEAAALAAQNQLERITLDDGRASENPTPALHPDGSIFDVANSFRGGDTLTNLYGVMDYNFGAYKIQPTSGAEYLAANPRPSSPESVGGNLTIATFNVLNYFSTIDTGAPICGPQEDQGCRGANDALEFERQRTKIIEAIAEMDADVVGLMEIENHPTDAALLDLVDGVNDVVGAGTYAALETGPAGPDVIKVAFMYKPSSVTAYGDHAVLDDASFLDPNNLNDNKNRAAVAQTFMDNSNGALFTAVVNHLKSKGSGCGAGDDDPEQGSCNLTRTLAAGVLTDWIQTDPTGSGDADFFIIGDLNSYDMEDPIDAFRQAGYSDLIFDYQGEFAYSYVFSGQWGYLDYIMANQPAAAQVTGTTVWHINADEPDILDYDTRFNPAEFYAPDAFRSSDHDPVVTGVETVATPAQALQHAVATLGGLLPTGDKKDDRSIEKAIASLEDALAPAYWTDDSHLTDEGQKAFDEGKKALQDLMRVGDSDLVAATIGAIVEAFAVVSDTAIQDAIAAGGDGWYVNRALDQMDDASGLVADGEYALAIDRYKKAWMDAQKAIAAAPERFATYNVSMNRFNAGDLVAELSVPGSDQPNTIAEVIQRNRPDVLLLNEFDYDADGLAAQYFQENYLALPQNGADPIFYPYWYVAPSNTGVPSGFDLDNNGSVGGPNDAFGFGFHEGQYGMVVYSMYPIDSEKVRTFQTFLWKDMPGALLPENPDGTPWFTEEELEVVRLSSKSHWDVPVTIGSDNVHFLVSHPTPPVFDGPEDRNGRRNFDEIRFWADYVNGESYIYDDSGVFGGLTPNARFVIAGDQNSDPFDGDSIPGSAQLLLEHPLVNTSITPSSLGGVEQSVLQGQANDFHLGDPAFDTADFNSASPGNLRVDYVLPRIGMTMLGAGVYWPLEADPYFHLVGTFPFPSSDHKLVWIDLDLK